MDKYRGGRRATSAASVFRKSLAAEKQRDSGSESAPLMSSGCSHTSQEHPIIMFHDSETSDLDSSPVGSSFRLGSGGGMSNYNSITGNSLLPKRLPPLVNDRISPGSGIFVPPNLEREKCYEIRNADSLLADNMFDPYTDNDKDDFFCDFFTKSLPIEENIGNPSEPVKPKQSSLVTIFSVWNTILGSSMLTMPWGIYMAGFVPAILLILAMSGLCLFTAYKLLQVHKYHGGGERIEVMDLSRAFLGRWAEHMAKIFSISVLMGANIAYWILMSNFLYNSVIFLYDEIANIPLLPTTYNKSDMDVLCPKEENGTANYDVSYDTLGPIWDLYKTVPIFLALLVFPVLNFNTTTFFTKFNSLGTVSILYLVIFVLVKSASWGINMDKTEWEESWILQPTFPVLTGMLSLSFFIHNIIITIMQSNRNQKKNGRDLTIAYILVTITYIIVGIVFYVCFPLAKRCIEDNILNNFQKNDSLTVGARFVLLFQLFTVYPLIAYMLRIQLLSSVFKTRECGRSVVLMVNLVIVTICVLFAVFMPHVGTIIRYTGAISGLVYVFTLPSLLHLMISHRQGTMTVCQVFCHTCVPIIGVLNLLSQFFIQAN